MLAQTARRRSVLAAIVASLLLLVLSGHALHGSTEHGDDHVVHCAVVVCLVVATLLSPVAPFAQSRLRRAESGHRLEPHVVPVPAGSRPQARASPGWLQRFLN